MCGSFVYKYMYTTQYWTVLNQYFFFLLFITGFFQSAEAVRTGSWYSSWKDKYIQFLGKIMSWSMVFYHPLEHAAYVGWEAPALLPSPQRWDANLCSALSCQGWAVYIVADLFSSILKLKHLLSKRQTLLTSEDENNAIGDQCIEINHAIKQGVLQCVRCLLYLPPSIHYSLPKWAKDPWLRSDVVKGLMFSEAIVCMYQSLC
jgi:hypothetical protein